jgi:L-iditol 2-dehydrogenase
MRRAMLAGPEDIRLEDVPTPVPGAGEVRVRVGACGLCGSDLHIYRGRHPVLRPPVVMGHEFVGRVTALGEGVAAGGLALGQRVVAIAGRGCGRCAACRAGAFRLCPDLRVVGGHLAGGLADEVVLPADQFVPVPRSLAVADAALVEVAAVARHAVRRVGGVRRRRVAVLGAGPLGVVLTKVARVLGARSVIASDVDPARRALALAAGADAVVDAATAAPGEAWRELGPDGFDVAFDCAGRPETLVQGLEATRRGGTVAMVAIFPSQVTVPTLLVQRHERRLVGVQMYERGDFAWVVARLVAGDLRLADVVTDRIPLERVVEAFRLLATGRARGKILVDMGAPVAQGEGR